MQWLVSSIVYKAPGVTVALYTLLMNRSGCLASKYRFAEVATEFTANTQHSLSGKMPAIALHVIN
jgi:hypothetical protein